MRSLSTAFREDAAGGVVAVLQAGALLVLLVACANLAGLLLARANDRQREVAVRTALGAGRLRIVRQLVAEIVLLALVASVFALFCTRLGLDVLRSSIPADMARYIEGWNNVRLDGRLVLVIPAFAVVIGLVVGLIPALSARRGNLTDALKEGHARRRTSHVCTSARLHVCTSARLHVARGTSHVAEPAASWLEPHTRRK